MIDSSVKNERISAEAAQNVSDFSIDHILHRAGNNNGPSTSGNQFSWLHCTRYCPPRLPRIQRKEVHKRQLGRHPRIPFTNHQLSVLEEKYQESPYLSSEQVTVLSEKLNLADIRVKIWFQNRRARERRERAGKKSEETEEQRSDVFFAPGNVATGFHFGPPGILQSFPTFSESTASRSARDDDR